MSSVTFSSGVHVGTRNDLVAFHGWFAPGLTTQFAPITLALSDVQVLTSVEGRAGDSEPVLLTFRGGGLPAAYDALKAIDCRDLLNGRPRTTLSGFRDAMARSGYLVQMSLQLEGDTEARTEWGVLANLRNTVAGGQRGWTVSGVFHPCDALGQIGTTRWYLTPTLYVALAGDGE